LTHDIIAHPFKPFQRASAKSSSSKTGTISTQFDFWDNLLQNIEHLPPMLNLTHPPDCSEKSQFLT
jgi:hypothetical protein